jgi:hypothetical protein
MGPPMPLRARRGGAPSEQGSTVPEMASYGPGWGAQGWRWSHKVKGDKEDVLYSPCVMMPSWASVGLAGIRSSRVSLSFFEGYGVEDGRER